MKFIKRSEVAPSALSMMLTKIKQSVATFMCYSIGVELLNPLHVVWG